MVTFASLNSATWPLPISQSLTRISRWHGHPLFGATAFHFVTTSHDILVATLAGNDTVALNIGRGGAGRSRERTTVAKEQAPQSGPPVDSAQNILEMTVETNLVVPNDGGVNAYELRNQFLLQRRLARVRYENGVTLPATARKLRADADRRVRHSRILARNIKNATGDVKHAEADAHHVVAVGDKRTRRSRMLLFGGASASTTPTTASTFRRAGRRRCLAWTTRPRTK